MSFQTCMTFWDNKMYLSLSLKVCAYLLVFSEFSLAKFSHWESTQLAFFV